MDEPHDVGVMFPDLDAIKASAFFQSDGGMVKRCVGGHNSAEMMFENELQDFCNFRFTRSRGNFQKERFGAKFMTGLLNGF